MKSPAWELGVKFVQRRQDEAFRRYAAERATYERDMELHEADSAAWKKSGRKKSEPCADKPTEPVPVRFTCSDATVEAVAVLLADNPRGVLVSRDELSGWLASFDAYKNTRGSDVAHWLSMHRAGPVTVDRKTGRRIIHVPHAAVSIAGSVQPEILKLALCGRHDDATDDEKSTKEHLVNGLAARLLLAHPPLRAKRWTDADIPDHVERDMDNVFSSLLGLGFQPQDDFDEKPPDPVCIPLTPDARIAFIDFYNANNSEQVALSTNLAAAWSKLEGYAARFALLFTLIENPMASVVDLSAVEAGIALSQWFGNEATRIYGEIGGSSESEDSRKDRQRQRLVAWIRKRGGCVTARDIVRGMRKYRGDTDAAEAALQDLVDATYGRWEMDTHGIDGGRPVRKFVVSVDTTGKNPGKTEVVVPSTPNEVSENNIPQDPGSKHGGYELPSGCVRGDTTPCSEYLFDAVDGTTTNRNRTKTEVVSTEPPKNKPAVFPPCCDACGSCVVETPTFDGYLLVECPACEKSFGCWPADGNHKPTR